MTRKFKRTIILSKIRRHIRNACDWHKIDDGMPSSWKSENWKYTKKCKAGKQQHFGHNCFYYSRSDKAIEEIAEKVYNIVINEVEDIYDECYNKEVWQIQNQLGDVLKKLKGQE